MHAFYELSVGVAHAGISRIIPSTVYKILFEDFKHRIINNKSNENSVSNND